MMERMSRSLRAARRLVLPLVAAALAALFVHRLTLGAPLTPPRASGEMAAAFALPDLAGRRVSSASFRGRPLLLNFWATWCPPCRAEIPDLEELSRARPGCLAVAGVAVDSGDAGAVAAFARDRGVTFPILMDDGAAARAYRVVTIPTSVLIGGGGEVLGTFRGAVTARGVKAALQRLGRGAGAC